LKHFSASVSRRLMTVAPRTGAWIETFGDDNQGAGLQVAPRTGAWIETSLNPPYFLPRSRRPPHGGVD